MSLKTLQDKIAFYQWPQAILGLLLVIFSQNLAAEQAITLAMNKGVMTAVHAHADGKTAIALDGTDAEIAAINSESQIWVYGKQRLQAYTAEGDQVLNLHYPDLPSDRSPSNLLATDNTVWLTIGHVIYLFDADGQLLHRRNFAKSIRSIHYDVKNSELLVTSGKYVFVLDTEGSEVDRIKIRLGNLA